MLESGVEMHLVPKEKKIQLCGLMASSGTYTHVSVNQAFFWYQIREYIDGANSIIVKISRS